MQYKRAMVATGQLKILAPLEKRLLDNAKTGNNVLGAIYGLQIDQVKIIVAASGQPKDQNEKKNELELLNEMIPCGIEPIGVFGLGVNCEELVTFSQQLPPPSSQADTSLILSVIDGKLIAKSCQTDMLGDSLQLETLSEEEYNSMVTVIRVRGKLELNCGMTDSEVSNAFRHLIEKVSSPYGSFMLEAGRVFFLHKFIERRPSKGWVGDVDKTDEEDCVIVGVEDMDRDFPVSELWQYTAPLIKDDGWGTEEKKVKVEPKDRMEFTVMWNYTNPACTSRTIGRVGDRIFWNKKLTKTNIIIFFQCPLYPD